MKWRYWHLIIASLLVALAMLAACGPEATPAPATEKPAAQVESKPAEAEATKPAEKAEATAKEEIVEIKFVNFWRESWTDKFDKRISDFEAAHPNIKVTPVDVPWGDTNKKLKAAAAGGGGETYDVTGIEIAWVASLSKLGYVEDLDPWLKNDPEFANSLLPDTPKKFEDVTRALSLYLIPYQFAYNVDAFKERGLEPPTGWEEYLEILKKTRDPATNSYGMSLTLQDPDMVLYRYLNLQLAQQCGQILDKQGNVAFNSPEGVAAVQWWKDAYQQGLFVPGSLSEDQTMMREFLTNGQTISAIDGPFIGDLVKTLNPKVKMAYAPPWKLKCGGYSWDSTAVAMAATSKHKKEAWEFIKFLFSPTFSVDLAKQISYVWASKDGMAWLQETDDPILKYVPTLLNQDLEHNVWIPILPDQEKLHAALTLAFQEAVTGKKDVKVALDEAAAVWQETIDAARAK